jgi:hypothetical protein
MCNTSNLSLLCEMALGIVLEPYVMFRETIPVDTGLIQEAGLGVRQARGLTERDEALSSIGDSQ